MDRPVSTTSGLIQGVQSQQSPSITSFQGIPYAASTTGSSRWKPPQPVQPWSGVFHANKPGDICPQKFPPGMTPPPNISEDCLNLNIWTPAPAAPEARLPVFVWIYGGRFIFGAGSVPDFDGTKLASQNMVVVTFNYRLGILGFLACNELSRESGHNASGNYGLLDQIAALQWVQANIASFGGDPQRVTIGGQSAGAASVMHLANSPLARGLFHAAISQSGTRDPSDDLISGLAPSYRTLQVAEEQGRRYIQQIHKVSGIDQMREMTVEQLLQGNNANDDLPGSPPLFRPVLDGWVKPHTYREALQRQTHADIPLIIGFNSDEFHAPRTVDEYMHVNRERFGNMFSEYIALYPVSDDQDVHQATAAAFQDSSRVSLGRFASMWKQPVYLYMWTHAPPDKHGCRNRGVFHGSEIQYVFGNNVCMLQEQAWEECDRRIAGEVQEYWGNFIRHGDPNGAFESSLPKWLDASETRGAFMMLGEKTELIKMLKGDAKVRLWNRFYDSRPNAW